MLVICSNNRALCWASCALGRAGICVTPATLRLLLAGGEQQRDVPWPGWNIIVPLTHSCPQEWRGMFLTKRSLQFEGEMKLFCSGAHEGHSTFAYGCKPRFIQVQIQVPCLKNASASLWMSFMANPSWFSAMWIQPQGDPCCQQQVHC